LFKVEGVNSIRSTSLFPMSAAADDASRTCWVCFASDEDAPHEAWVRPCGCRGGSKWVHQNCLNRWIDEKQRGDSTAKVECPQCREEYVFTFPRVNNVVRVVDLFEKLVVKTCPYLAGGFFVGAMYWSAVTYGAITIMQVMGNKEGLTMMEESDPIFLLVGLPTIPAGLVLAKLTRWEDYALQWWRDYLRPHLTGGSSSPGGGGGGIVPPRIPADPAALANPVSSTRLVVGAMMMPTFATVAGQIAFRREKDNFRRTMMGGATFLLVKGLLKLYYKQQQYERQVHRQVLDYDVAQKLIAAAALEAPQDI